MSYCVSCGSPLPSNQGSRTCSMCYGDPDHGRDGYYRRMLEEDAQRHQEEQWEREREQEGAMTPRVTWVRHASWVRAADKDMKHLHGPNGERFLACCDCGWVGGFHTTMPAAGDDAEVHVRAAYQGIEELEP